MTTYVCRLHPDYRTTPKGTGCAKCAHELDAGKRARRRSWRPFDADLPDWASGATTSPTTTERTS